MNTNYEKNNLLKIIKEFTEKENQIGNKFWVGKEEIYEIKLKQIFKFIIYSQYVLKMVNIKVSNEILKNIKEKIDFIKSEQQLIKYRDDFNKDIQYYEDINNKVFPLQITDSNSINYLKFIKIWKNCFCEINNEKSLIEFKNIDFIAIQHKSKHPKVDKKIFKGLLKWVSNETIKNRLNKIEKKIKKKKSDNNNWDDNFKIFNKDFNFNIRVVFEMKIGNRFNKQAIYCQNINEAHHIKNILILYNSYLIYSKNLLLNLIWKYKIQRANQFYLILCIYFKFIKKRENIFLGVNSLKYNEISKKETIDKSKFTEIILTNFYFPMKINDFKNQFPNLKKDYLPLIINIKLHFFNIYTLKIIHEVVLKGIFCELSNLSTNHEYYYNLMKIGNLVFLNYNFIDNKENKLYLEDIFFQKNKFAESKIFLSEVKLKISFDLNNKNYIFEKIINLNSYKNLKFNTYILENNNNEKIFINITLDKYNELRYNNNKYKFKPLSKTTENYFLNFLNKKFNLTIINTNEIINIYEKKFLIFNIYYDYLSKKIKLVDNYLDTKFLNEFSFNIEIKFLNELKKFAENINKKSSNSLRAYLLLLIKNTDFDNKINILNKLYNITNFDILIEEIENNQINLFYCLEKDQIQKNLYNSLLLSLDILIQSNNIKINLLDKILKYIAYSLSIQIFNIYDKINSRFLLGIIKYFIIICNFYLNLYQNDENYLKNIEIEFQILKKTISINFPIIFNNIHYKNSCLEFIFYKSFSTNFINFMNFQNFTIFNDILMCLFYYLTEDKIFYFTIFKIKIIEVIINDYYEVFIKIKHPHEFYNFFYNIFSNNINFNTLLIKAIYFMNDSYQSNNVIREKLIKNSNSVNIMKIKKFYDNLKNSYSDIIHKGDLIDIINKSNIEVNFEELEILSYKITEYFKNKNSINKTKDVSSFEKQESNINFSIESLDKYKKFIDNNAQENTNDKYFDLKPIKSEENKIIEIKIKDFNNEYAILRKINFTYNIIIFNNKKKKVFDFEKFNLNLENLEILKLEIDDNFYLEFHIICHNLENKKDYLFKGYFFINTIIPNVKDSSNIILYNGSSNFNLFLTIEILLRISDYDINCFKMKDILGKYNLYNNLDVSFIYYLPDLLEQNSILNSINFKDFKNYINMKNFNKNGEFNKFKKQNLLKIDIDINQIIHEYFEQDYQMISIIELFIILIINCEFNHLEEKGNEKINKNTEKNYFKKKLLLIFKLLLFFENLTIKTDKPLYLSLNSIKYFYKAILNYYHLNFERNIIFNHVESLFLLNCSYIKEAKIFKIENLNKEILIMDVKNVIENILFNNHRIYGKKILYINKNFINLLRSLTKKMNGSIKQEYYIKIKYYSNLKFFIFRKNILEILNNEFLINFEQKGIFTFDEFYRIINQDFLITSIFKENIDFNNEVLMNYKNQHFFLKLFNSIDFYVRKTNEKNLISKDEYYEFYINGVPINTPHIINKNKNSFIN